MMTDPEARKDPRRMMALARRANMQSMRTNNTVGMVVSALLLVAGAIAAVIAALVRLGVAPGLDSPGFDVPGFMALLLVPMGGFLYTRVTVVLQVQPENGQPFQIDHREVIDFEEVRRLHRGATVPVRLTPGNPRRMAIDWDAMGA